MSVTESLKADEEIGERQPPSDFFNEDNFSGYSMLERILARLAPIKLNFLQIMLNFWSNLRPEIQQIHCSTSTFTWYGPVWFFLSEKWWNNINWIRNIQQTSILKTLLSVATYLLHSFFLSIKEDFAIVELKMDRLPTERFKRYIVKGKLDLVGKM